MIVRIELSDRGNLRARTRDGAVFEGDKWEIEAWLDARERASRTPRRSVSSPRRPSAHHAPRRSAEASQPARTLPLKRVG